ncbi:MAG TPA: thioredoxin family protein [Myxococcales bacterium]|nr:thioredoxin family protein [Myxococcales bacterium]
MLGLLLLALSAPPPGAALDDAVLGPDEASPECKISATQPMAAEGGSAHLTHARGQIEQVLGCGDDVAVIDFFETGAHGDEAARELEQSRWGGESPPARLHDALLRRKSVLADVSGSRATAFLLQTKLQKKGYRSLGGSGVDFATIEGAMAETLAEHAPPLEATDGTETPPPPPDPPSASGPVDWRSYDDGLREAAATGKPVCLTFFTTWCPHCRNFLKLFDDPRVAQKSRSFVMVRVNEDQAKDLGRRFSPDGSYIPRTFFLSPQGQFDRSLAARPYGPAAYNYAENDADALLQGMNRALARLGPNSTGE